MRGQTSSHTNNNLPHVKCFNTYIEVKDQQIKFYLTETCHFHRIYFISCWYSQYGKFSYDNCWILSRCNKMQIHWSLQIKTAPFYDFPLYWMGVPINIYSEVCLGRRLNYRIPNMILNSTTYFLQKDLQFNINNQISPVLRDHLFILVVIFHRGLFCVPYWQENINVIRILSEDDPSSNHCKPFYR